VVGAEEFDEFYIASYQRLLRQVILVAGNRADAEDALQEAYARAAARWRRLRRYDLPEAWVRRVAMNLLAEAGRRARRRAAALLRIGPLPVVVELTPDLLDLAAALRVIPVAQRQVIVLHHLVGLPVEEVAHQLRVPVGTVKSRLGRGRRALAGRLALGVQEVPSP
jgi:RNA polymerase sigma-70 factor, ECF subfamily